MSVLWKMGSKAVALGRLSSEHARAALLARRIERFERRGAVPWSAGYLEARSAYLERIVRDEALLARLAPDARDARDRALPDAHGIGIDERAIEIPWILARWRRGHGRALDAGSALNHPAILGAIDDPSFLTIFTLRPEAFADWRRGVSYQYGDLREMPFRDGWFERIACISTLEHVGMDNRGFGDRRDKTDAPLEEMKQALRELWRVLAPGGELCVTVPFGRLEDHGAFLAFDEDTLTEVLSALPTAPHVERFRYSSAGWQRAEAHHCGDCGYVSWLADAFRSGRFPEPVPLEPDRAAAARAVACISLVKARG